MFALSQLARDNAELLRRIEHFSFPHMAQLVAAMMAIPEFHQNSLRLEALVHLAAIGCKGADDPTRDNLQRSLNCLMPASMAQHEDPPSDVFIGSVNSDVGSFRLFLGSYDDGDFWIERLLNFVIEKQTVPVFLPIVRSSVALLRLGDAIAKRLMLVPYTAGARKETRDLTVPRWNALLPRVNAVYFSSNDLQDLQINEKDLRSFILEDPMRDELVAQTMWSSVLEAKPLVRLNEGFVVGALSSLPRTIVRFIAGQIQGAGLAGSAEISYDQETARDFINLCGLRLELDPFPFEPPTVADLLPMSPAFGTFAEGRAAIMLTINPPFFAEEPLNLESMDRLSAADIGRIDDFISQSIKRLETENGLDGGLVLVCLGGFGRTSTLAIKPPTGGWILKVSGHAEWHRLISSGDCSAMRLYRFGEHIQLAEQHKLTIQNFWGLVELFAYWQLNDYRLIPQQTSLQSIGLHMLDGSFSFGFNARVRRLLNVHCVANHEGTGIARLERFEPTSLFKSEREQETYVDTHAHADGRLVASVETRNRIWWARVSNSNVPMSQRHHVFELWKCVLHWMAKVSLAAEKVVTALSTGSIAIDLDFLNLDCWRPGQKLNAEMPAPEDLQSGVSVDERIIRLRIPEGFLTQFNQPKNRAEKAIVRTILQNIGTFAHQPFSSESLEKAVSSVVPNDDARHFHVLLTQDIHHLLHSDSLRRPKFIAVEDMSFSQVGLGYLGKTDGPRVVIGKRACQDFLQKVVTSLWERIEFKLKGFSLLSVATFCSRAVIELERDKDHWRLSSRALLALHSNQEAHDVITKRNSTRALATMCNRLVVEIAQYAANVEEGRQLTSADHLGMLADCSNLLNYAQHRDAISYGFMDAKVQIAPNGELLIDMDFYDQVMIKYITKHSEQETTQAAENYDEFFKPIKTGESTAGAQTLSPEITKLSEAFAFEYKVDLLTFFKIGNALATSAIAEGKDAFIFNNLGWMKFLKDKCSVPLETGRELLNSLQLPIRSAFNKDLPQGCHENDIYPWRFRRKLSLLSRPLIQTRERPGNWITFATTFDTSIKYLVGHIERGAFPQTYFKSKEMRSYSGEVVNKLGHRFTASVAKVFENAGIEVRKEVEMRAFGAGKNSGLGDVDVLAWNPSSRVIFVVECKRLRPAFTVREVVQRLDEFRGDQKELDSLGRHTRRVDWLRNNLANVAKFCGLAVEHVSLVSVLVTSDIVPMQFFEGLNFSCAQVVPFEKLAEYLSPYAKQLSRMERSLSGRLGRNSK